MKGGIGPENLRVWTIFIRHLLNVIILSIISIKNAK